MSKIRLKKCIFYGNFVFEVLTLLREGVGFHPLPALFLLVNKIFLDIFTTPFMRIREICWLSEYQIQFGDFLGKEGWSGFLDPKSQKSADNFF